MNRLTDFSYCLLLLDRDAARKSQNTSSVLVAAFGGHEFFSSLTVRTNLLFINLQQIISFSSNLLIIALKQYRSRAALSAMKNAAVFAKRQEAQSLLRAL